MRYLLASILVLGILNMGQASSAPVGPFDVAPDYPGRTASGAGFMLVAPALASISLQAYYSVHEQWPRRWQDLVDEGFVQAELTATSGQVIDPSDQSLDFSEDIFYEYREGQLPLLHWNMLEPGGLANHTSTIPVPLTWPQMLDIAAEGGNMSGQYLRGNLTWYREQAFRGILSQCAGIHRDVEGHFAADLSELLRSGLTPFDPDGINPLSGKPWLSPDDRGVFVYKYIQMPQERFTVKYIREDGLRSPSGGVAIY